MKRKNIIKLTLIMIVFVFSFVTFGINTNVYAEENNSEITNTEQAQVVSLNSIFDIKGINGEYKTSSENSDMYLPFFRNAIGRIEIDNSLGKIGILSTSSTIDVNAPLKNIQFLLSADTIRINSDVEYALLWASNDVVINSSIERNAVIFAGGTVTIEENVTVNDDVIIIANSVNIKGTLKQSALISASNVNVSGKIERDLRCGVTNIELSGNDNVKGNVYITTYTKDINIKDKYPNAVVDIKEVESKTQTFGNILLSAIISCLAFTLLYLIVKKITKGKAHEKMLNKVKNNTLFVVLSGSIYLLSFPAIFIFLILISFFGLYMLTVPILIVYVAFLIVFWMLAIYVVGSTIFEYINKKYIKAEKLSIEMIGVFFTFLSLTLLTKIPTVGSYIWMAIIMIAMGIMITYFLKKDKNKEVEQPSIKK